MKPDPDTEATKAALMKILTLHSPQENFRLDGMAAFSLAIDVMEKFHPNRHQMLTSRDVFKQIDGQRFMYIKNAKAACWALDHLREKLVDA